jgi:hypothetical protein
MTDNTANRGYRIPETTDAAVNLTDYWRNLGDDVDADVAAILANYLTPVPDTSLGTAAANFTAVSQNGRKMLNGKLVYLSLSITSDNTLTPSGGDLTDVPMFTVDSSFRPSEQIITAFDDDHAGGTVSLNTSGVISVRTAYGTVVAGRLLSFNFCFIKD